jgi:flagellar motor switch protein FliM
VTAEAAIPVMRRKAGALRRPEASAVMTPARAWHTTLPRVSADELGLDLAVRSVRDRAQPASAALSSLPEDGLLLLLRGGDGRTGLCCIDPGLLSAVIEMQTTGKVGAVSPPPRRSTAVDAALAAGLVDAACTAFDAATEGMADPPPIRGARQAGRVADLRAAALLLGEGAMQATRIDLDLGGGVRPGAMILVMSPMAPRTQVGRRALSDELRPVVMEGQATLRAVLHRTTLPLARIRSLAPGERIVVPGAALGAVAVEGGDGRVVAQARLGQVGGWKALRLTLAGAGAHPQGFAAATAHSGPQPSPMSLQDDLGAAARSGTAPRPA